MNASRPHLVCLEIAVHRDGLSTYILTGRATMRVLLLTTLRIALVTHKKVPSQYRFIEPFLP